LNTKTLANISDFAKDQIFLCIAPVYAAPMNLDTFLKQRDESARQHQVVRGVCLRCLQPPKNCYCAKVQAFDPLIKFVILLHPIERRRRIATGRMAHLCLQNSELIAGHDFSKNNRLNQILGDPGLYCALLYPGPIHLNLSDLTQAERQRLSPPDKKLCIIVVDGTWHTARKMVRLSRNLQTLPQIAFTPKAPSRIRVRKQPRPECYSTIEAIHLTLELLRTDAGARTSAPHDHLLVAFDYLVEQQLQYVRKGVKRHQTHKALVDTQALAE
jgi:DTW domain-containing protein YfiP